MKKAVSNWVRRFPALAALLVTLAIAGSAWAVTETLASQTAANGRSVPGSVQAVWANDSARTSFVSTANDPGKFFFQTDTSLLYYCSSQSAGTPTMLAVNAGGAAYLRYGNTTLGNAAGSARFFTIVQNAAPQAANTRIDVAQTTGKAGVIVRLDFAVDTAAASNDVITVQTGATVAALADTACTLTLTAGATKATASCSASVANNDFVAIKSVTVGAEAATVNPRATVTMQ
jgi:hypothetical protein